MEIELTLTEPQDDFVFSEAQYPLFIGGFGCVHGDTLIATKSGFKKIKDITSPELVLSWSGLNNRFELALSGGAFPKGRANLYRVVTQQGEFVASGHHHLLCADGSYQSVQQLCVGASVVVASQELLATNLARVQKSSHVNDEHYFQKHVDLMGRYANEARLYDQQLREALNSALDVAQQRGDVQRFDQTFEHKDAQQGQGCAHSHPCQLSDQSCRQDLICRDERLDLASQHCVSSVHSARTLQNIQEFEQDQKMSCLPDILKESPSLESFFVQGACVVLNLNHTSECNDKQQTCHTQQHRQVGQQKYQDLPVELFSREDCSYSYSFTKTVNILSITQLDEVETYYDMQVLDNNNYISIDGCIHHNSGKSESLFKRLLIQKLTYPKLSQGYFAPSYDLISLIAFPRLEELLTSCGLRYKLNKSEKVFHIQGYGQIIMRSMDNPDSIVGFEIADAVIDELDTMPKDKAQNAWNKVISRCRQKKPDGRPNTAAVGTTPEGFRFCYERWEKNASDKYVLYRAPTMSNPYLPESYIDGLRESYPPQLLAAYLDGQFVNLASGGVYPDFDRKKNHTDEEIKQGEPLHIGMDFNVLKMAAVVFVMRQGKLVAVDELVNVRDTPAMAELIKEKYKGHHIKIYPDAAGQATSSKNASESDHAILKKAGFSIIVNGSNPAIKDRINAVNAQICNSNNVRSLLINTNNCPNLTEALEQQVYDKHGMPDKSTGHDHVTDAFGYCIVKLFPIIKPQAARQARMYGAA